MAETSLKKMKPTTDQSYLSDDIIFSVLSRLPVKSLLRFTSVSKSWNAMIKSSDFIAAHHLHHHIQNNTNKKDRPHLVHMPNDGRRARQACTLLSESDALPQTYVRQLSLHLPLRGYEFVRVCEGLICLTKDSDIYIWNPLIRSLKILPPSGPPPPYFSWAAFGFGFARRSSDFRVVKLSYSRSMMNGIEIYSFAAGSWRRIECKPAPWMISSGSTVFFEGSIYWLGFSVIGGIDARRSMFRFDLEDEVFVEIAAPPFVPSSKWQLAVANGSLVFLEVRRPFHKNLLNVCVWTKKEPESPWTGETFMIPKDRNQRCSIVSLSKSGHLILERSHDRKLFAYEYDSINNVFRLNEIEISNGPKRYELISVKETLFLMDQQ